MLFLHNHSGSGGGGGTGGGGGCGYSLLVSYYSFCLRFRDLGLSTP